jgi:hypothetical protein
MLWIDVWWLILPKKESLSVLKGGPQELYYFLNAQSNTYYKTLCPTNVDILTAKLKHKKGKTKFIWK